MTAWTKDAPKEPGWYWAAHDCCNTGRGTAGVVMVQTNGHVWDGSFTRLSELGEARTLIGPRIPSPETLARVAEFLRTASSCGPSEEPINWRETARALLAELEGTP